jgi:hypothetical protein
MSARVAAFKDVSEATRKKGVLERLTSDVSKKNAIETRVRARVLQSANQTDQSKRRTTKMKVEFSANPILAKDDSQCDLKGDPHVRIRIRHIEISLDTCADPHKLGRPA